jgi:predicted nucleic acid-binding protein
VVVDACVLVALGVADDRQDAVARHIASWVESGEALHAPAILPYEIANVLARLVFDGTLAQDDVPDIWADLSALDLELHAFELAEDGPAIAEITTSLRRRHATDSAYIRLAQQLGTHVWTLDTSLARNAAEQGFRVRLIA